MPAAKPDFLAGLLLSEREQEVRDLAGMLPRRTPQEALRYFHVVETSFAAGYNQWLTILTHRGLNYSITHSIQRGTHQSCLSGGGCHRASLLRGKFYLLAVDCLSLIHI